MCALYRGRRFDIESGGISRCRGVEDHIFRVFLSVDRYELRWTDMSCRGRYITLKTFFSKALYAGHRPSRSKGVDVYLPHEIRRIKELTFSVLQRCTNLFIAISNIHLAEHLFKVIA